MAAKQSVQLMLAGESRAINRTCGCDVQRQYAAWRSSDETPHQYVSKHHCPFQLLNQGCHTRWKLVSLKMPKYCLECLTANLIRYTKGVIFLEILTNPQSKLIVPYLDSTLCPNSTHNVGKHVSITLTVTVSHTMSGHPPNFNNLHFSRGLYTLRVLCIILNINFHYFPKKA